MIKRSRALDKVKLKAPSLVGIVDKLGVLLVRVGDKKRKKRGKGK